MVMKSANFSPVFNTTTAYEILIKETKICVRNNIQVWWISAWFQSYSLPDVPSWTITKFCRGWINTIETPFSYGKNCSSSGLKEQNIYISMQSMGETPWHIHQHLLYCVQMSINSLLKKYTDFVHFACLPNFAKYLLESDVDVFNLLETSSSVVTDIHRMLHKAPLLGFGFHFRSIPQSNRWRSVSFKSLKIGQNGEWNREFPPYSSSWGL